MEEGTLNNKEPARLIVSGTRPRLMARDSFQLAMFRKAASDGLNGGDVDKDKAVEEVPSSDDSSSSDGSNTEKDDVVPDDASEEEEETQQSGSLASSSLIQIILQGAEDLLTLEEAYTTLTGRLRQQLPSGDSDQQWQYDADDIRVAINPIKEQAPPMIRAIQRDIQRLLGKVPATDIQPSESSSSPFRNLMPLRDSPPSSSRSRLTPSPTPSRALGKRPSLDDKPKKQGYTEAEVRYRREAAGVGCAALRFIALIFNAPHLFNCFSEVDLISLLDQIMVIPRTPSLPTPNTKRTYYLSILILAHMRIPSACVSPVKEKVVRALDLALADNLGGAATGGSGSRETSAQIKKEAFHAIVNIFKTYPSVFFAHYTDILPPCLRLLTSPMLLYRRKASAAICAVAAAKVDLLQDTESKADWTRNKAVADKLETFVCTHLKSVAWVNNRPGQVYTAHGEKRTEWLELERVFKDTVGSPTEVQWACATWASLVTLIGGSYATCGFATSFDHIMDVSHPFWFCVAYTNPSALYNRLPVLFGHPLPVSHGLTPFTPTSPLAP